MKTTESFKKTISDHLQLVASNDVLFAETLKKENKNIDDCITYILNTVKKSNCNGFDDSEIFGMAIHYYDEDIIEVGKPINGNVVVNHKVEITKEDKFEAKKKAMELLVEESRIEAKKELSETIKLTPDDIADAKKMALEKVVDCEREKMLKKSSKPKKDVKNEVQSSLFD